MSPVVTTEQATAILSEHLVGNFISRFSVGDTWDLGFGSLWLIAQEIRCPDADRLMSELRGFEPNLLDCVDVEYVPLATLVASFLRRDVTRVAVFDDARVELHFGEGRVLEIPTDVDIVDWQWSLGETDRCPYTASFTLACLWQGEIVTPVRGSGERISESMLPPEWRAPGAFAAEALRGELRREAGPGHPLHRVGVRCIAKHVGSDDVLFELIDHEVAFAVVHLTWSDESSADFPATTFFESREAFLSSWREGIE